MNSFLKYLLLIFLFKSIYNENDCIMLKHNFYLLPIEKKYNNNTIEFQGLQKYDYILILKTEPNNEDKYHIVLDVSFPINVNIELSHEIIYYFNSLEEFCINDLAKEGKYVNILGKLSEFATENSILERIWIKIEKVLLYKELELNKNRIYYLLTNYSEYDEKNKQYILMNKMYKGTTSNQIFQIVSAHIIKDELELNNYLCAIESNYKNDLVIGDELIMKLNEDKLRDNMLYYFFDKDTKKYKLGNVNNLLCITYSRGNYGDKC